MFEDADRDDPRLAELLLRWEELREQGQSVTPVELCSDCPELAGELARRIALLRQFDPVLADASAGTARRSGPGVAPASVPTRESAAARAIYQDLRFHASGALGEVFLAKNAELNREVALKFIKSSRARDPESLRRFLQEAEVTGRLEHPGVVPIYALGADPAGAPCYAMRFIRGATLQYAIEAFHASERPGRDPTERALALRELLTRFISVCSTVAYAHSRGILHRDLKPRNIMLGRYDETLVVDWGLAKPFSPGNGAADADEEVLLPSSESGGSGSDTPTVGAVGTLAYMSPEQAEGRWDLVGPASDIFSLGAILYAILTGYSPYQGGSDGQTLDRVQRCEFRKPRDIRPEVPRALEAICLHAMARLPANRYATAIKVAEDVKCYLADEPVNAWREPLRLRAQRWARRRRTLVTSATVVLLLTVGGLSAFAAILAGKNRELDRQRQRALAREALAIDAVKKFRDVVQDNPELKNRRELELLRKALLKEPLEFFSALRDQLQSDRDTRPEALARLAGANLDLARTTGEVGSAVDAIQSCTESITVLERLTRLYPAVAAYRGELARSLHALANLYFKTGQITGALESWQRAATIFERVVAEHPANTEYQRDRAKSLHNISLVLYQTGRLAEALESHRQTLAIQEQLARDDPTNAENWRALAASHHNVGNLFDDNGQPVEAMRSFRQAKTIWERLTRDHPLVPQFRLDLCASESAIANLLHQAGQSTEAIARAREAMAIREKLALEYPAVSDYQSELAESHYQIGNLLGETGHQAEALLSYRRALELRERLAADNPTVTRHQSELANIRDNIGSLLASAAQAAEALELHKGALAIRQRLAKDNPRIPDYQHDLGDTMRAIAEIEMSQLRWRDARLRLEDAIEHERVAVAAAPHHPDYRRGLAHALLDLMNVFLALDQPALAIRTERELLALPRESANDMYDVARALALSAPIKPGDPGRAAASEAVRALKQAVAAGWTDAGRTSRDKDLLSLRDRADFRQLLAELFDRGFPADPFTP
jgi:serine/threonine protein kinase